MNECAQACEAQAGCVGFGHGGAYCDGDTRGGNGKGHCNVQKEYVCDDNHTWDWHALGSGTKRSATWYAEGGSSTYGFVESASFLHLADLRIWKGKQLDISAFNLDEVQDWNYPYKTDGAGIPVRGLASPTWQGNGWHLPDDGFVCNNDEPPCEVDDPPAAVPDTSFTLKWWHPRSLTLPLFGYSRAEWAALTGDPHITGAHGDHADIKGADGGIYSLLSTQRLSLAVRFEHADFTTPYSKQLVHGSWVRAAFWVLRLRSGELLRVAYDARHRGKAELEVLGGGGRRVSAHTLGKGGAPDPYVGSAFKYERGGVGVALDTKKHILTVRDRRWLTTVEATDAKPHPKQLRMNVKISKVSGGSRMVSAVAPHGLLGQGFDGDGVPLNGRQDTYTKKPHGFSELTTHAAAEGAIEGTVEDYRLPSPYATAFKYSRFDAKRAVAPRNATAMHAGLVGPKKRAPAWDPAGGVDKFVAHLNFVGSDLKSVRYARDARACYEWCRKTAGCAAFSYITHAPEIKPAQLKAEPCWLKKSGFALGAEHSGGTVSGVLAARDKRAEPKAKGKGKPPEPKAKGKGKSRG